MKNVIEVEHLVKQYQSAKKPSVNDVSFTVKEGEFFTFLGPNGAGKTTTISILNTTLAKSSGLVKVAGYDVDSESEKVRRKIGVIFQNPSLDANLTAEENVRFHAILYGIFSYAPTYSLMPKAYKKKVDELASLLGIQHQIHQPIKTFSGGMKRKLEIIRGLIHDPVLLFLDEPTTGLDPESRKNLWTYLQQVRKDNGTTIFLTTHYLDEAELSDRVCIIADGQIARLTTPTQLKKELLTEQLIIDTDLKHRPQLLAEMKRHRYTFSGDGPFAIQVGKEPIQDMIKELTTKLTVVKTQSPSLEEAYLAVLDTNKQSNP